MALQIHYKAQLKALTGIAKESVTLNAQSASLTMVLKMLSERHPSLQEALLPNGVRNPSTMVFLNQKQVTLSDNPDLSDADNLILMSAIAGG